jgi:signal peptidase I
MENESEGKLTWRSRCVRRKILYTTLTMAFICYAFFTWVLWPVKVVGQSMMPNYHDGARHFINKLAYSSKKPQRGDVIALRAPNGDVLLKRIVGLPGETISFEDGVLHINGKPTPENYTQTLVPTDRGHRAELGEDEYFVIGDNRAITVLSPILGKQIIGKVAF